MEKPAWRSFWASDVSRGIRIEKALQNDLTLNFIGTDVVGFGTTLLVLESQGAVFLEKLEHLQ